jgi:transcriptional regulator with XRE-family HTH domain
LWDTPLRISDMQLVTAEKPIKGQPLQVDRQQARSKNMAMDMEPDRLAAFAKRVNEERKKYGSRSGFASAVGISRATLRALERGGQQPSQETINQFARFLKTTPEALTGQKRIDPDDPRLEDLTDEDLDVAQLFHHAGLAVKQKTLGTLQERQRPHGLKRELAPDVIAVAEQLIALDADRRYTATLVLAALKSREPIVLGEGDAIGPLDPFVLEWAARMKALPDDLRGDATGRIEALEKVRHLAEKKKPGGSKPPPKKR